LAEGAMVIVFANSNTLAGSIVVLVVFSTFVQMAEGTSFGIVPYIDPPNTGSLSGIIGAGGNVGAVGFGLGFRQRDYLEAFYIMGGSIVISAITCAFVFIPGHRSLLCGVDDPSKQAFKTSKNVEVPEAEAPEYDKLEDKKNVDEDDEELKA
jgi:NNP family nitrate/nitrite transporter-like MFS transporter